MKEELHENEENKRTAWQRKGGIFMKDKIMKGKMTKRVLSFILTLAMVFSLMPGKVEKVQAAEDVKTVETLEELKTALNDEAIHRVIVSQTITLAQVIVMMVFFMAVPMLIQVHLNILH